jgi:hypothetical protein
MCYLKINLWRAKVQAVAHCSKCMRSADMIRSVQFLIPQILIHEKHSFSSSTLQEPT